jgi:bifunctional enzyme CysN/CysC
MRHVVLAVNKMDLVGGDFAVFDAIAGEYTALAASLGIPNVQCIPMSALRGDNLVARSEAMPWYEGPALLEYLDTVEIDRPDIGGGSACPCSGCSARIGAMPAAISAAMQARSSPARRARRCRGGAAGRPAFAHRAPARARRIADAAESGQAVMVSLEDEIDVSRGDVIASAEDAPEVTDQFAAHVLWMGDGQLLPGRPTG